MRVGAVIGERPMAMLTLTRLRMSCGFSICVALSNDHIRVAACLGGADNCTMQSRVRLQCKRRLGRRKDRRAKNNEGKESAEQIESSVWVTRLSKNERGTAVLVGQGQCRCVHTSAWDPA